MVLWANQDTTVPDKVTELYRTHMPEAIASFADTHGSQAMYKYCTKPDANATSGVTKRVNGVYNDVTGIFLDGRSQHIVLDPFEQKGTWCSTDPVNTAQGRPTTFLVTFENDD